MTACRLCGSPKGRRLFDLEIGPICACPCGLRFVAQSYSDAEQREFYSHSSNYEDFAQTMKEGGARLRARTVNEIARACDPDPFTRLHGHPPRLLEVGCGAGDFLVAARERGFEVRGLEISSTAADLAKRW